MAVLDPGKRRRKGDSLSGSVLMRIVRGRLVAQKWPSKRGKPKQRYQQLSMERLRISQRLVHRVWPRVRATLQRELEAFLAKNRGVRGTAAIRVRDWETMRIYGRDLGFVTPAGQVLRPAASQQDASDILDWMEPRIGSLLVRTDDAWLPTHNCEEGRVFCMTATPFHPGACPLASLAKKHEAIGGYP